MLRDGPLFNLYYFTLYSLRQSKATQLPLKLNINVKFCPKLNIYVNLKKAVIEPLFLQ